MEPFKQDFENIKTYALKVKQSSENLEKGLLKDVHEQIQIISELKEQLTQKDAEIKKKEEENCQIRLKFKRQLAEKDAEIVQKDKEHSQIISRLKVQLLQKDAEISKRDKEQSQLTIKLKEQLAQKDTESARKVEEQSQMIGKLKEQIFLKDSEIAKRDEEHCQILSKVKDQLIQNETELAVKVEEIKNLKTIVAKKDLKLNQLKTAVRESRILLASCDDETSSAFSVPNFNEKLQNATTNSSPKPDIPYSKKNANDLSFQPDTGLAENGKNDSLIVLSTPYVNKTQNSNSPTIPGLKEQAITSCETGNWEEFVELLQNNMNISCAAYKQLQNIKTGKHILMSAAISGCLELISMVLESGFPVNQVVGPFNRTMLHCAVFNNHVGVVDLLLSYGADMEAQTVDNWTALHYASNCGHLELVKLLITKGCNVNALNKYNETALHCAAEKGHKDIIQYLLENGCDKHGKNKWNKTALDLAVEYKQHFVIPVLT